MVQIPPAKNDIAVLIDAAHEAKAEKPRPHMGASILGHRCDRWIWLSFRWAVREKFSGRMMRLFRRGHLEEAQIMKDLDMIGVEFSKRQAYVNFGSHVSGSADAIIERGVPEASETRHIAEFKTHNKKSFDALERDGVQKAKPQHWAQMQVYMHGTFIDRALYVAVCKDDDRMYTERVRYVPEVAEGLVARGQRIAMDNRMPPPLSTDPSWYICKWCPAHDFCHQSKLTQEVNCRTCAHATPKEDSTWRCERWDSDGIPVEHQHEGCESHVLHYDLVPWDVKEGPTEWTFTYIIDGKDVVNGEGDATVFASSELIANPSACANPHDLVQEIRAAWPGARISK